MFDIENSPETKKDSDDKNQDTHGRAKIMVIGIGGGGCNAVNTMIREGLTGVRYVVANTDAQALQASLAEQKIQLGIEITKGLGAGANPEIGKQAAMEDYEKVADALEGSDMVFITAGMGGGTGTGAAPVIAKLSKDIGALTVGVVTKPFRFEGKKRKRQAETGITELESCVDSLITIPNEKLLELAGDNLTLVETFKEADGVLLNAVRGISDLINNTGLINADFADVATVMLNKGMALMGTGIAKGEDRALEAAKQAISSPLLEDISIEGATGVIVNISGDESLTTAETNKAMNLITDEADEEAEIIFGTVIDETLGDEVRVTVIATGLGGKLFDPIEEKPSPHSYFQQTAASSFRTNHFSQPAPQTPDELQKDQKVIERKDRVEESTPEEDRELLEAKDKEESKDETEKRPVEKELETTSQPFLIKQEQEDEERQTSSSEIEEENKGFSRAKRIAQKLGFMNFEDEDFDTPSHERNQEHEDK